MKPFSLPLSQLRRHRVLTAFNGFENKCNLDLSNQNGRTLRPYDVTTPCL